MKTTHDLELERELLDLKLQEINRSIVLLMTLRDELIDLFSEKFENL